MSSRSTLLYKATFNNGEIEEHFYAADDEHAGRVAHEIAARQRILLDAVKLVASRSEDKSAAVAGRIFNQERR